MIKLLKYELLRKKKAYIIVLCIYAVFTLLTAIGIPQITKELWVILVALSAIVCIVGCALFPFIINVANYYRDYKNRNGYMMFLTPSSGSKIFGSKILAAVIDALLFSILLALYVFIAYSITNANYNIAPFLNDLWSQIELVFPTLDYGTFIAMMCIVIIVQHIGTIILALFSITVSKTLLSHRSINWFVPLIVFFVFEWIEQFATTLIIAVANFKDFKEMLVSNTVNLDIALLLMMCTGIIVVFSAVYTISSSVLISKKLDL